MTRLVVPIVEGDGEVQALPVLLRRIAEWRTPQFDARIARPIRVRRDRFLHRPDEFDRMLGLAAAKAGDDGAVLVLLDADDECPAELGPGIVGRIRTVLPHMRSAVVLANREYEAWFIAGAASLQGVRGFACGESVLPDPELLRDAKGWMRQHTVAGRYGPVHDQAAFSERLDLALAYERSRSFRKLVTAWTTCCSRSESE